MKYLVSIIISLSLFFSSISNSFAEESFIDNLLNISYEAEEINLNLSEIKDIKFKEKKYNNLYKKLKKINHILKSGIIKNYKNWKYDYYKTNWIINSYNNFIFYVNDFLLLLKFKEENKNYWEINSALYKTSLNIRSNYIKLQNIIRL